MSTSESVSLLLRYLTLIMMAVTPSEGNMTDSLLMIDEDQMKGKHYGEKKTSFITFETREEDIRVELEISTPFLTVPLNSDSDDDDSNGMSNKFYGANINLGSLGLAGAFVFGSSFILPSLIKIYKYLKKGAVQHIKRNNGRVEEKDIKDIENIENIENRDSTMSSCTERVLCFLVQKSQRAIARGDADAIDLFIYDLVTNENIKSKLKHTIFNKVVDISHNYQECSTARSKCKISVKRIRRVVKNLSILLSQFKQIKT